MNRDELLAALAAERYDNRWWHRDDDRAPGGMWDDSDVNCGRRRKALAEAWDEQEREAG